MGRYFDWRAEVDNIWRGMDRDMFEPVGLTIPWFVYDADASTIDDVYDVGATPSGRRWKPPRIVPVISVAYQAGRENPVDEGLYISDTLRLIISADQMTKAGLDDVVVNPDAHDVDRVVYRKTVWSIKQVRVRGVVRSPSVVVGVDCFQQKGEEMYNDPQFQQFIDGYADGPILGTVTDRF